MSSQGLLILVLWAPPLLPVVPTPKTYCKIRNLISAGSVRQVGRVCSAEPKAFGWDVVSSDIVLKNGEFDSGKMKLE